MFFGIAEVPTEEAAFSGEADFSAPFQLERRIPYSSNIVCMMNQMQVLMHILHSQDIFLQAFNQVKLQFNCFSLFSHAFPSSDSFAACDSPFSAAFRGKMKFDTRALCPIFHNISISTTCALSFPNSEFSSFHHTKTQSARQTMTQRF